MRPGDTSDRDTSNRDGGDGHSGDAREPKKAPRKKAAAQPASEAQAAGAGAPAAPVRRKRRARGPEQVGGLLGLGLDNDDGHKRVTRGEDFLLLGGSEETHGRMQDLVVRMSESLQRKGRRFTDLTRREFEDLARDTIK